MAAHFFISRGRAMFDEFTKERLRKYLTGETFKNRSRANPLYVIFSYLEAFFTDDILTMDKFSLVKIKKTSGLKTKKQFREKKEQACVDLSAKFGDYNAVYAKIQRKKSLTLAETRGNMSRLKIYCTEHKLRCPRVDKIIESKMIMFSESLTTAPGSVLSMGVLFIVKFKKKWYAVPLEISDHTLHGSWF